MFICEDNDVGEFNCFIKMLDLICLNEINLFGRHQFFGTSEHYGKTHGSLLSG